MLKILIRLARWLKIPKYTTSRRIGRSSWSAKGYCVQSYSLPLGGLSKTPIFHMKFDMRGSDVKMAKP
jgi:hypothetical protein